jgi:hypothetical protein
MFQATAEMHRGAAVLKPRMLKLRFKGPVLSEPMTIFPLAQFPAILLL